LITSRFVARRAAATLSIPGQENCTPTAHDPASLSLQTQVRGYLLEEIKGIVPARAPRSIRELTLQQRAANSLILRHLRASGFS
jgi:hypothetical protein